MKKLTCVILLTFVCSACSAENIPPYKTYRSVFDTSRIAEAEFVIGLISQKYSLELFEKDKRSMKALSEGEDAFFTAFYFEDDPIIMMTNVGVAKALVVNTTDYGKMDLSELDKITSELVLQLNEIDGVSLTEFTARN